MSSRSLESELLLSRIAEGLKREDESNAEMWRDATAAARGRAIAELGTFALLVVQSRGFPIAYGELEFPPLPRPGHAS